jgi:hypothetical protein
MLDSLLVLNKSRPVDPADIAAIGPIRPSMDCGDIRASGSAKESWIQAVKLDDRDPWTATDAGRSTRRFPGGLP